VESCVFPQEHFRVSLFDGFLKVRVRHSCWILDRCHVRPAAPATGVSKSAPPAIASPTDAIVRISANSVCGSDLWPYRGLNPINGPTPMGHEYCGIVEEVGKAVSTIEPGQFVIGSFFACDNTSPHCRAGYPSACQHKEFVGTAQAPWLRVPLADGTLVATPDVPSEDLVPSLLTLSDVMGTGWFAAVAANVQPGSTVAVVGDGAVGLLGVLAAKRMGVRPDHRDEPSCAASEARARVCHGDCRRSGRRSRRPD
jgi:threonine dehydrogenase-like Zn-dependent dehydrogenase